MKKKLNCILLIDDDDAINFIHDWVINKVDCAEKVEMAENGIEALKYLESTSEGKHPQPDLIFLDINMPGMNGWEFLEEYHKLDESKKGKIVLVMLTSSLNPDDLTKSKNIIEVSGFQNKPLTVELMQGILKEHFEDYL
ncbi:response regulator [Lutibacter citreus]|uniref:response regulator n=1 Tax=Lutibacter citreus TaxID=2138210 RepID=UPI000DBE0641|nr:response regulator [Lutibacter citreus]